MLKEITPVAVDTKTLSAMFSLSRQHLNRLEKDPNSGFPPPFRIGRSVRHSVQAVTRWLEATTGSNAALLQNPVQKKVAPRVAHSKPLVVLASIERTPFARKPDKLTMAEVKRASEKARLATLETGQRCVGNMIDTKEGVPTMLFRLMPHRTKESARPATIFEVFPKRTFWVGGKPAPIPKQVSKPSPAVPPDHADHTSTEAAITTKASEIAHHQSQSGHAYMVSPEALKFDYETGLNLDALCKRYHIGKSRASKMLRAAGARMRKAGRSKFSSEDQPPNRTLQVPMVQQGTYAPQASVQELGALRLRPAGHAPPHPRCP
jgi:predicted DNA-binding transcriptional regulator AlpA